MTSYNPYSPDRSISIPPPTPPPIVPQQTVDPVNRALSLPPGASSPAPVRNSQHPKAAPVGPGGPGGQKPGLPPPHPVHQLLLSQQRQEDNQLPIQQQPPSYLHSNQTQQFSSTQQPVASMQNSNNNYMPPPPPPPMFANNQITSATPNSKQLAPVPAPPPPPPPPPGGLGVVSKCGPSGSTYTGRPVKSTMTLAEIRAGNTNYGPASPDTNKIHKPSFPEPVPESNRGLDENFINKDTEPKITNAKNPPITNDVKSRNLDNYHRDSPDFGLVESLNEFEAQRIAMMSPTSNINNFTDSRRDNSCIKELPENATFNSPPTQNNFSLRNESYNSPPPPQQQQQQQQYQKIQESNTPFNGQDAFKSNGHLNLTNGAESANVCKSKDTLSENNFVIDKVEPDLAPVKNNMEKIAPPQMNDDINMSRPRERSVPKQLSLQKDCEAHNVTPKAFEEEQKRVLTQQKSLDKDDLEILEINKPFTKAKSPEVNDVRGRRDSHTSIRFRPETPRTVTPVRFSATPKLPNKGLKSPEPSVDQKPKFVRNQSPPPVNHNHNQSVIRQASPVREPPSTPIVVPVRNSDSGISVNSTTSDQDDLTGKMVAESMQQIEAQMKRILEQENNAKNNNRIKTPSPLTINIKSEPNNQDSAVNGSKLKESKTYFGNSASMAEEKKSVEKNPTKQIKQSSFEVMEDFEEAPEEFDLGISSYSIAHPIENIDQDEMERTPVPEISETDEAPKFPYLETPYVVSTPSGTLKSEKNKNGNKEGNMRNSNQHQDIPVMNPSSANSYSPMNNFNNGQQYGQIPSVPQANNSLFNPSHNMGMGNMMG